MDKTRVIMFTFFTENIKTPKDPKTTNLCFKKLDFFCNLAQNFLTVETNKASSHQGRGQGRASSLQGQVQGY